MEQLQFSIGNFADSPLLFNRRRFMIEIEHDQSLTEQKGESAYDHQVRIYKKKAEYSADGHVIIPGSYFKKAFSYSQRQTCCPIKPAGTSKKNGTLTQALSALFIDNIVTKYTADDLVMYEDICCISKGMNKSSILVIRPQLTTWEVTLNVTSASDLIGKDEIEKMLEWTGIFCGIGDYRPERGGMFGRFLLK